MVVVMITARIIRPTTPTAVKVPATAPVLVKNPPLSALDSPVCAGSVVLGVIE
jgi:hypothetical protein